MSIEFRNGSMQLKSRLFGLVSKVYNRVDLTERILFLNRQVGIRRSKDEGERDKTAVNYYDLVRRFQAQIQALSEVGKLNLILHRHIGDSFVVLNIIQQEIDNFETKVNIILRKEHEDIMRLFPKFRYKVFDIECFFPDQDYRKKENFNKKRTSDLLIENVFERAFIAIPQLSAPFILSPIDIDRVNLPYANFVNGWARMLGFNTKKIKLSPTRILVSSTIKSKYGISDLSKVVLLCPSANSVKSSIGEYWDSLIDELELMGLSVFINSTSCDKFHKRRTINFELSELISIGQNCRAVVTLRSGLSDILAPLQKKLVIINPPDVDIDYLEINQNYVLDFYPLEIVLKKKVTMLDIKLAVRKTLDFFL